ncbi:hypothetical protein ACIS_00700 [Anaplasma centrale str. Israel]|uniref:Transmembrane protein n=1 Tax=Anaplasma centrale (strain Israel) TaxID=574556 RepID=D1AUP2_ANACI|nr:hypothetical protein [Anaplasma centrale]ACZ49270.1 hypothetical protein ACIS_00700 [Anaplasma centrale str. Israel]
MRRRYYGDDDETSCCGFISEMLPTIQEASLVLSFVFFVGMAVSVALLHTHVPQDIAKLCAAAFAAAAGLCVLVLCITTIAMVVSKARNEHTRYGNDASIRDGVANVFVFDAEGSSSLSQSSSSEQAHARTLDEQSLLITDNPTAAPQACQMRKESTRKVMVISATPVGDQAEREGNAERRPPAH